MVDTKISLSLSVNKAPLNDLIKIAAIDCGLISTPPQSYAKYPDSGTTYGRKAQVKCNSGYKHNDTYSFTNPKEYKCHADGQWKHVIPDSGGKTTTNVSGCVCE